MVVSTNSLHRVFEVIKSKGIAGSHGNVAWILLYYFGHLNRHKAHNRLHSSHVFVIYFNMEDRLSLVDQASSFMVMLFCDVTKPLTSFTSKSLPPSGPAAHGSRAKRRPSTSAGLHHPHNRSSAPILFSSQQPLSHGQRPPTLSCPTYAQPTPPLCLHSPCHPGLVRHSGPPCGVTRYSTSCSPAWKLSTGLSPTGPGQHGPPSSALTYTAPQSVPGPVCPPGLHQRLTRLHCLHWIPAEPHQGQPVPLPLEKTLTLEGLTQHCCFP